MTSKVPAGMTLVSWDAFFAFMKTAMPAWDIMPNHDAPYYTMWLSKLRVRYGWSSTGWRSPYDPDPTLYALNDELIKK